jgi:hypothetical protein
MARFISLPAVGHGGSSTIKTQRVVNLDAVSHADWIETQGGPTLALYFGADKPLELTGNDARLVWDAINVR